jgi:hypothetical protein
VPRHKNRNILRDEPGHPLHSVWESAIDLALLKDLHVAYRDDDAEFDRQEESLSVSSSLVTWAKE